MYRVTAEDLSILAFKNVSLRDVDKIGIQRFKGEIGFLKKLTNMDRVVKLLDSELDASLDCPNLVCFPNSSLYACS